MGESKITSCLHAHENENISKSLSKNFRCENRSARFEGIDSQDLMSFRLKESQNSLFKVGGRIEWFELIKGEEWKCESVYSLSFFFFFFLSLLSFFFFFCFLQLLNPILPLSTTESWKHNIFLHQTNGRFQSFNVFFVCFYPGHEVLHNSGSYD